MNIVIPMAGEGSRFRNAGYSVSKPFIEVMGKPMFTWAVNSLPLALASRLIFVCREEDRETLEKEIRIHYVDHPVSLVSLEEITRGQSETVLKAAPEMDLREPLLIYNADTYFRSDNLDAALQVREVEGLLGVFEAPGDRWSFARLNEEGDVVQVAEKERISEWACTGLYFFRNTPWFLDKVRKALATGATTQGEYYVAPLYQDLLDEGAKVTVHEADRVWVLGTPEDLAQSLENWD